MMTDPPFWFLKQIFPTRLYFLNSQGDRCNTANTHVKYAFEFRKSHRASRTGLCESVFSQLPGLTTRVSWGYARDWTDQEHPYHMEVNFTQGRRSGVRLMSLGDANNPSYLLRLESLEVVTTLQEE